MTSDTERNIDTPSLEIDSMRVTDSQFEIRFITKLPDEFRVPEDKIIVPGSVDRLELSDLVNDMGTTDKRVPYDFLINGEFLRGSLSEHCLDRDILSEKTVEVEYVIAMFEPETTELDTPGQDWITGVAENENYWFTCSMGGVIAQYDRHTGDLLNTVIQSSLPLTGIFCTARGVLVFTSKDGHIRFCDAKTLEVFEKSVSISPIQTLSVCPFDHSLALTGTTNGELHLWNVPMESQPPITHKKKRASAPETAARAELTSTSVAGISGIQWISLSQVIVGSLDGTVQIIDPISNTSLPTVNTNRSISAMALLGPKSVVTGHPDGRIIFWNIRNDDVYATLEATNSCRSHTRMISDLRARPYSEFLVASSSIDGTIKLFDSRAASYAVQSIPPSEDERALSLCWIDPDTLLSGSSDGVLRSHSFKQTNRC